MKNKQTETVWKALDNLRIELPSWGFANTGTRFGKFIQLAAASTIEEKFSDAAQVHAVTGACPTLALHVQWDLPNGLQDAGKVKELAKKHGVKPGSINPNVFQDQEYKYGSVGNPDASIRRKALNHILDCVRIAEALNCRDISAWGMALLLAKAAGPQAYVLVDTGHHYQAQNIEQIVAWLLHHEMIGGFHFNDRRYADDDLTLGSIDPYQVFRIFHEILAFQSETNATTDIAFMVDQSHNLKGKIEAMIQTVCIAQELYAKAAAVDHDRLPGLQQSCSLVDAEECMRGAFWTDVRPIVVEWRKSKGLPEDPMNAFRESGYQERATRERRGRHTGITASYA